MRRSARSLVEMNGNGNISYEEFASTAFFNVNETDAAYLDEFGLWHKTPDKKALIRDDGSYISTVGKNYSIIDNQEFFEGIIEALDEGGIEYVPKAVFSEGNGKRTSMIVTLPQYKMFEGTSEVQDFELRIRNSFDTTLAADSILGFLRLICTNGMTSFTEDFRFRMTHKGNVMKKAEDAVEMYQNFNNTWDYNKEVIERMSVTHGDKKAVSDYIGDGEFTANNIFTGPRWAGKLLTKWQESGETTNFWNLYNIFTYILSHEYGNNYSSKVNRMQMLNREVKSWNKRFKVTGENLLDE